LPKQKLSYVEILSLLNNLYFTLYTCLFIFTSINISSGLITLNIGDPGSLSCWCDVKKLQTGASGRDLL